ncbi:sensor histidine kinase [Paenibacillaceae bacterium WGS1546]|uniref:sensor histidine kinase n=1 Tax=Cohnella sp. WGS1546 TaxID=3366810 RepID=UPI00372D0DD0
MKRGSTAAWAAIFKDDHLLLEFIYNQVCYDVCTTPIGQVNRLKRIRQALQRIVKSLARMTLKTRILYVVAVSALVPFFSTVWLSYDAMSTILSSKLESSVSSNLTQVQLSFENTFNNINHISQQLAVPGIIGNKLDLYLMTTEPFQRQQLFEEIKTELNLITFTNPTIGLAMYYFQDQNRYLFENAALKDRFSIDRLPLFSDHYKITNFGPHVSNERYNNEYVLSALRKVDLSTEEQVYVYVESNFKLTRDILNNRIGENSFYVVLNRERNVTYSELPDVVGIGGAFLELDDERTSGTIEGYYWFRGESSQGWSLVSLIPQDEFNKERDRWVVQIALLFVLFLSVIFVVAWFVWKMIYKPLRQFNQEIKWISHSNFQSYTSRATIPEFDGLLLQLHGMKKQIANLISEIENKEKKRADLEIEKLMYQINPHFLMNTLDTIHWLAVMNGQSEIDRLVLSLNKLLYYNLGKLGKVSTVGEELESLNQYLVLQQIRYDFKFDLRIEADERLMHIPLPRFILQPLVENALYHGMEDDGIIRVEAKVDGKDFVIIVQDNGGGIAPEKLRLLLEADDEPQEKVGMGIGMRYVKRMIESYYKGRATLMMTSVVGEGTTVRLVLPLELEPEGGLPDDQSTHR